MLYGKGRKAFMMIMTHFKITDASEKNYGKIKIHRNFPYTYVKSIFTENVNFTENFDVTRLQKNFCKNHRNFLTVYIFDSAVNFSEEGWSESKPFSQRPQSLTIVSRLQT
jgi:hypothetical protein